MNNTQQIIEKINELDVVVCPNGNELIYKEDIINLIGEVVNE